MTFHDELEAATAPDRALLMSNPLFADALAGRVNIGLYIAFLREAYHHVRHTVPLMMACGARLPAHHETLRTAIVTYIDEEVGHENWILEDIAASGGDPRAARDAQPSPPTELMVAYAWDTIMRGNPVGFFGMVHVLEGTSTALATRAAGSIRSALGLPPKAFRYLTSHGSLDIEHVKFFRDLVDGIALPSDRAAIVHASRMFYRLYGDIFRHLHQENLPCVSKAAA